MTFFWPLDFYPRPPRGGRRFQDAVDVVPLTFLSTPSARRETSCQRGLCPPGGYFYPRPPRGGRLAALSWSTPSWGFLSTPSARRATCITGGFQRSRFLFLSTPSARRATANAAEQEQPEEISIHALREEGDCSRPGSAGKRRNFYPRPPRGGRHPLYHRARSLTRISIHALREEGDL